MSASSTTHGRPTASARSHRWRLAAFGPTAETLTTDLVREVFDVEAQIVGAGAEMLVNYLRPSGPAS